MSQPILLDLGNGFYLEIGLYLEEIIGVHSMFIRLFLGLFFSSVLFASEIDPALNFYQNIADIRAPTRAELLFLQKQLLTTHRPIVQRMDDKAFILEKFKFIGESPRETPISGRLVLNCAQTDIENCIIIYTSFNERYPQGARRLLAHLKKSDFKGHVYYKIGGWPNIANGDLNLAHVPFAFKPCFFKEVQAKNYKKVLWLDTSILTAPGVSLNSVFETIGRVGTFIQVGDHSIEPYMNETSAAAFGLTLEQTKPIWSCSAAIIGFDFENPKAVGLLDAWYEAAHHPDAFFSSRSDQNALSILIHQMGFKEDLIPRKYLGSLEDHQGRLFMMDRSLVKDK